MRRKLVPEPRGGTRRARTPSPATSERFLEAASFGRRMQRRPLGKTGLQVSEIGFGAWAIGGDAPGDFYGPPDDGGAVAAGQKAGGPRGKFFGTPGGEGWGGSEEGPGT